MNKFLSFLRVLILIMLLGPQVARAQWAESFESGVFPPEGWTCKTVGELDLLDGFFLDSVREEAMPFTMDNGKYYVRLSAQKVNTGTLSQIPEAWLISPELTVEGAVYLKFDLATYKSPSDMDTLDVFVSESGGEPADFTDRLLRIVPNSVFPNVHKTGWSAFCVDMTAWKGKTIRLAFRSRAHVKNYPGRSNLGLDHIRFENGGSSDLSVLKLISPVTSCNPEQKLAFEVYNGGQTKNSLKVWYSHNGGDVKQTIVNQNIPSLTKTTVHLDDEVMLVPGANKFTIYLESADERAWNDTLRVGDNYDEIGMSPTATFPYTGSAPTEGADFSAFFSRQKWTYMEYGTDWVWMGQGAGSSFLVGPCMNLPAGKIRISFDMFTSGQVNYTFYRMKNGSSNIPGEDDIAGSGQASLETMGFIRKSFVLNIPENGWQAIGIFADNMVLMKNISFETMPGNLALTQITAPLTKMPVSNEAVSVSVKLTNQGEEARGGFALCYRLGNEAEVRENYVGQVAADATVEHTFALPVDISKVMNTTLTVWLESDLEEILTDDTLRMNLQTYEAVATPYHMSFEGAEDFSVWTVYNPDHNAVVYWDPIDFSAALPNKGNRIVMIPAFEGSPAEDMLISPALKLTPGCYRISFFYAGRPYLGADMNLSVLYGRSAASSDLKPNVLAEFKIDNNYWLSGYAKIEVEEAGLYYFAFYAHGMAADIFLDDIRIDQEQDVCIVSTAFNEKSGFNKTITPVSVVFRNHGARPITSVEATYAVNDGTPVTETVALNLQPGAEYTYEFVQKADISSHKAYTLSAKVDITDDSEPINNTISGEAIQHYTNRELPYFEDFAKLENRLKWEIIDHNADGNSWIPAAGGAITYDAYSGSEVLVYSSQNGVDGDDYIFSECVELPASEALRLSYFYRTFKNIAAYKEDFTVGIYSYPHPDSLKETVHRYEQVSVPGTTYEKEIYYFTPKKAGQYYIGFHSMSKKNNGFIYIDDIRLEKVQPKDPLYISDFQNNFKEWDVYNPSPLFDYWAFSVNPENSIHMAVMNRRRYAKEAGLLVSPAFAFKAGNDILMTLNYRMTTRSTDKTRTDTLDVYMGYENHPDSLSIHVARLLRADTLSHVYVDTVRTEKDSPVYFGFKVRSSAKSDDETTNFYIERFVLNPVGMQTYTVSGQVIDPENQPIENATVVFSSQTTMLSVRTDAMGQFKFENLFSNQSFMILAAAEGYDRCIKTDSLADADIDMGSLQLKDKAEKPMLVRAVDREEKAVVSWVKKDELTNFRYDNGKIDNSLGLSSGTLETPMGVVHRQAATLIDVEWYLVRKETPRDFVSVFVFDLDQAGNPTDKILYRKDNVPNTDNQWCRHELEVPLACPNGFMIGLSCKGFLALACDDGQDADYPFVENTHYIIRPSEMQTFESQNIRRNLFLRANGVKLSDAKRFEGFEVKRFLRSDRDDETKWVTLTETPVTGSQYEDLQWKDLPAGFYTYAVRSVYSLGVHSAWQFSNELACKMTASCVFSLASNLNAKEAGATVRLSGEERGNYYETKTNDNGEAVFERILKGSYRLSILKDGFHPVSESLEVNVDAVKKNYTVKEAWYEPKKLRVVNFRNSVLVWNDFANINESFETSSGHATFAINSAGDAGWTYIDADNTYTLGYSGLDWSGKGNKMAYQVFNPAKTKPVMQGDYYKAHGGLQYLTTFPSYGVNAEGGLDTVENNDWLITPQLDYSGDFNFSFYARSVANHNGLERMNVYYSVGGHAVEDFVKLTAGDYTEVPAEWTQYTFHLPAEARYVAVQCVSRLNLQFMLDDIEIKAHSKGLAETYVVYVDGQEALRTDKTRCDLSELKMTAGRHKLGVKAVYKTGESAVSEIEYDYTANEDLTASRLVLYPNPVTAYFVVESAVPVTRYAIYNTNGRRLAAAEVGNRTFRVEADAWPGGVYQIELFLENGQREVRKFVKLK